MFDATNDAELARRCAEGDHGAWAKLVKRYSALVWSVIGRVGLSSATCDDAFQEVFASAWTALPKMKDPTRIDAWLVTTARRTAWRLLKAQRRQGIELPEELSGVDQSPEIFSRQQETRLLVRRGLDALSPRCRELLIASFSSMDPPNYDALATQLGMPRGSLGPTRQRCLERLASELRGLGLGESA